MHRFDCGDDDNDGDDPVIHTRTLRMLCGAPTCATSRVCPCRAVQHACLRKARAFLRRVSMVPVLDRAAQQLRQVSSAPTTPPSPAFPRRLRLVTASCFALRGCPAGVSASLASHRNGAGTSQDAVRAYPQGLICFGEACPSEDAERAYPRRLPPSHPRHCFP